MQWCNIFEDPDTVGESVYLAIHNAVGTMTFGCDNPNPAVNINKANQDYINDALVEFIKRAAAIRLNLIRAQKRQRK